MTAAQQRAQLESIKTEWQNAYGAIIYTVLANVKNVSDAPIAYVKVKVQLFDKDGKLVAERAGYNAEAEILDTEGFGGQLRGQGEARQTDCPGRHGLVPAIARQGGHRQAVPHGQSGHWSKCARAGGRRPSMVRCRPRSRVFPRTATPNPFPMITALHGTEVQGAAGGVSEPLWLSPAFAKIIAWRWYVIAVYALLLPASAYFAATGRSGQLDRPAVGAERSRTTRHARLREDLRCRRVRVAAGRGR